MNLSNHSSLQYAVLYTQISAHVVSVTAISCSLCMQINEHQSVRFVYIVIVYYIKPHGSYNSKIQVVSISIVLLIINLGVHAGCILKLNFKSELRGKRLEM